MQIVGTDISHRLDDVKNTLSREVLGNVPAAIVLGGADDGKVFLLKKNSVNIGRLDPENRTSFDPDQDIVLSEQYSAVTRVSKPHARITREKKGWFIEDSDSTGGTQLNNKRLEKNISMLLRDGDLVELSKGVSGAKLLMIIPPGE